MLSKLTLPALVLGAALMFAPNSAQARERERVHHHHRFSVVVGVTPRHYVDGHYDRWGYWRPTGPASTIGGAIGIPTTK